jgi:HD-like signal output (HDOD) protein
MSLGFDHQSVGELLLRRWGLPAVMQPCAGFHHSPTKGPGGLAASVVHVADHLANAMRTGTSGELLAPPLSRLAWDMVGLSVDDLAVVMEEIDLEVDSHRCMLSP